MTRTELKEKLPHGYQVVVAKRLGVTSKAVNEFLNGRSNSLKIELMVLKVIAEIEYERIKASEISKAN